MTVERSAPVAIGPHGRRSEGLDMALRPYDGDFDPIPEPGKLKPYDGDVTPLGEAPKRNADQHGDFVRGLKNYLPQTRDLGGALTTVAGVASERAFGQNSISQ